MKKITLLLAMMIAGFVNAQTLHVSVIDDIEKNEINYFCADTLVIHADSTCFHPVWYRPDWSEVLEDVFQLVVTEIEHQGEWFYEDSNGANIWFAVYISSPTSNAFNPFDEPFVWKRSGDTVTLGNPEMTYVNFQWSTGETSTTINVVQDGTYSVEVDDPCGPKTYSIQVRDNVELYRATVDLATGLNKVTWLTTPEQAEYVSQVRVERDGMTVATVPYEDGQFIDNIGSENAARNYRLTAIGTDGTECPIPSYQKGTLHVDYSPNANNPNKLNMAWTPPFIEDGAPIAVAYFQICKYDPATGEVTVIDQIGANSTIASYDENLFDGGYATVAALFSESRAYDDMSFSNLTEDLLATSEKQKDQPKN